ncbi:MAG: hypothetical protein PUG77_09725 [Helicobacter bilis]|uniref:hypothetical protein n=1 Tax=Helicobacter bilis TaxID=37372 RepID=UPI0026EE849F|nr:hypothetical protein [Helicobacter bilis]MDD7297541.1 hypothetical protein [Helicobacter bilis]
MQSYEKIISGEQGLLEWIVENATQEGLDKDLPDDDSLHIAMPEIAGLNFMPGMLDGIMGKDEKNSADTLLTMFRHFAEVDSDALSDELIDKHLGGIYMFIIQHRTLGYIDGFLEALINEADNNARLLHFCITAARQFLRSGVHREAIKFGIAVLGICNLDEKEIAMLLYLGLADEFARFVAVALMRNEKNDEIFYLAKRTKGWGRIAYVDYVKIDDEKKREWLLLEGYQCEIGIDHIVLECLEKGDLLGFIKERGFDEKIYTATGQMLKSFCGLSKVHFADYPHSKELVALFIEESKNKVMNIERFAIICALISPIEEELEYDEKQKKELLDIINTLAFHSGIDWEGQIRADVFNYDARSIARHLGIDIWEDMFNIARENTEFKEWYPLTLTNSKDRYKRLCALAKERFDLKALKSEPKDELGLGAEFRVYDEISFIVQNLRNFDEIIGLEFVETALQSPVTRCRNMALNVIETYKEIPQSIIDIMERNSKKEPNKGVLERYEKLLQKHKEQLEQKRNIKPCGDKYCKHKWHLQVWGEFYSSGIWSLWSDEKQEREFPNVGYELLGLPQDLAWKFTQWQRLHDEYGLYWYKDDADEFLKKLYAAFNEQKLELAKALKAHFKGDAYIETYVESEDDIKEIKYYYVLSDYDCGLWDEEACATLLESVLEDDLGIDITGNREEIEKFDEELSKWAYDYFELEFDGKGGWVEVTDKEIIERGRILTERVKEILPHYCVVEYRV